MSEAGIDPAQHLARVGEFVERFGRDRNLHLAPLDASGITQVQRGSAVVSIHCMADQGVLLLLAKVLPASAVDDALCRRLLERSFLATGDAAFALHPSSGDVYLRILRGLDGLDYDEFEDLVHTIAVVADEWDDRLKRESDA